MKKYFITFLLSLSTLSFSSGFNTKINFGLNGIKNTNFRMIKKEDFKYSKFNIGIELEKENSVELAKIFSFDNGIGIDLNTTLNNIKNNSLSRNIDVNAMFYYQPALRFNVLDDFSVKFGLKLASGILANIDLQKNLSMSKRFTITHSVQPSVILGFNIKNFLIETEFGNLISINWKKIIDDEIEAFAHNRNNYKTFSDYVENEYLLKFKVGYSFK